MTTTVAVIGAAGAYGRWLCQFFHKQLHCRVLACDPALPDGATPEQAALQAEVLVFSAPIRQTPAIIAEFVHYAGRRSRDQLWLDVTSLKQPAVTAMLQSEAEVVGLHPMCAAPKTATLRDRVLVVCEARLDRWRPWLAHVLAALDAETVYSTPAEHDRIMALVQGLTHASHLAQAQLLSQQPDGLADLATLMRFRSPVFALDMAVLARLLTGNPAIYEDIQFLNPHLPAVLAQAGDVLTRMATQLRDGSPAVRAQWRAQNLSTPLATLGAGALHQGQIRFEQLAYLLADLDEPDVLVLHLPRDEPGELRRLLTDFAERGINLNSLHSSRDGTGKLHFRLGLDRPCSHPDVQTALAQLVADGVAVVVSVD